MLSHSALCVAVHSFVFYCRGRVEGTSQLLYNIEDRSSVTDRRGGLSNMSRCSDLCLMHCCMMVLLYIPRF